VTTKRQIFRGVLSGAYYGLIAWMAYAVLEFALATTAPLRSYKNTIITPWYWQLSFTLGGLYAVAGLVLGALGGYLTTLVVRGREQQTSRLLAIDGTATLMLGFSVNLFTISVSDILRWRARQCCSPAIIVDLLSQPCRPRTGML
jgi:hypothetical protein